MFKRLHTALPLILMANPVLFIYDHQNKMHKKYYVNKLICNHTLFLPLNKYHKYQTTK